MFVKYRILYKVFYGFLELVFDWIRIIQVKRGWCNWSSGHRRRPMNPHWKLFKFSLESYDRFNLKKLFFFFVIFVCSEMKFVVVLCADCMLYVVSKEQIVVKTYSGGCNDKIMYNLWLLLTNWIIVDAFMNFLDNVEILSKIFLLKYVQQILMLVIQR